MSSALRGPDERPYPGRVSDGPGALEHPRKMVLCGPMRAAVFLMLFCLALAPPARGKEQDFADTYYAPMTYANVALLYWAVGLLDTADDQAVEGYLRIRECPLYQRLRSNDIAWAKVREDARASIAAAKVAFPKRLALVQPVTLGPYDPKKRVFVLSTDTAIWGMKLFEVRASGVTEMLCDPLRLESFVPGYSPIFIFELGHPFTLRRIPVTLDFAEAYLSGVAEALDALPPSERTPQRIAALRQAYLVLKLRFVATGAAFYNSGKRGAPPIPHLLAVLERYDLYTDRDLTQHLYGTAVRRVEHGD